MGTAAQGRRPGQKDIVTVLTREHRVVAAILDKIEEACEEESFDEVPEMFGILNAKLTAHAKGEEAAVYPRFAALSDEIKDLIGEANEEHALVEDKLHELSGLSLQDDEWKAKFTVLKELVEHHVEDEEGKIFPAVQKEMTAVDSADLADEYLATKRRVAGEDAVRVTAFDLEVLTKEELLEEARAVGLEGISSMSKSDLVEALASRD